MSCWALIALKAPAAAKGRLAEALSIDERRQLVRLMFDHVLGALRAARHVDGIAIVTAEPLLIDDVTMLVDPGYGLNAALAYGAEVLTTRGADELLVLHADLPLLTSAQIDQIITSGRKEGLTLASDKSGQGTNAIYLPLPTQFVFHFGLDSCRLHLAEAARLGCTMTRLESPGLAFDVDEPQDLARLLDEAGENYGFLRPALLRYGKEYGSSA